MEEQACPTYGSCSGMFTANSMNCLTEALGLALPGNGTTLATHTARRDLYERAGATTVGLARRFSDEDDASALPRAIASREAFEHAIALEITHGGPRNYSEQRGAGKAGVRKCSTRLSRHTDTNNIHNS